MSLKRTDELRAAVEEMNSVLGAHDAGPATSEVPPLRISRPISLLLIVAFASAAWATLTFTPLAHTLPPPLAVVAAGGSALLIGTWLPGGAIVIDGTSVRQVGQRELTIPVADVRSFRVERHHSGLASARLVAETSNGDVAFDSMVATWGQVSRLDEIAHRLNQRLAEL